MFLTLRIISAHSRSALLQHRHDDEARGVAHVVGVRLEGDAKNCNSFSAQRFARSGLDTPDHRNFALEIHALNLLDNRQWRFVFPARADQG